MRRTMRAVVSVAVALASTVALGEGAAAKQDVGAERSEVAVAPPAASGTHEEGSAGAEPGRASDAAARPDEARAREAARRDAARREADERRFLEETWTRP